MRSFSILALAAALSLSAACRGDDDGETPDGGGNGTDGGAEHTVYDVQSESMPEGTLVTLRGVVVVAVDTYGGRTGSLYVMEPDGGPYSGVAVFLTGTEAAGLTPGDLVDVEGGVKDEFSLDDDEGSITQISAPQGGAITIEPVGTAAVPDPEVLNSWDLAADPDEAEKWEGVLIQFNDVAVLYEPDCVGSACNDPTLEEMTITGPFAVQSSLTEMPDAVQGDCYSSITGIGDYFYSYKIQPRTAADYGAPGTDCPAPEEGETACMDGEDNDHNGFADCADFSCIDTVPACSTDTTIVDIQNGTVAVDTPVVLDDVIVTAISDDSVRIWLQDAGGAAVYNGVKAYLGSNMLPNEVAIGSVVDVMGTTEEYFDVTQLDGTVVTVVSAGSPPPTLVTDYVDLTDAGTAEPYEGVLVELQNVEVQSVDSSANSFMIGDATNQVLVDDYLYAAQNVQVGACYAKIVGVIDWYMGNLQVLPRNAADLQLGGTCN